MRKVAMALAMLAVVVLVGCQSVPDWVTKGSGAYPGDCGKAIYGVGISPQDPNFQLQRDMARMNARTELARSEKAYLAELCKQFRQRHKDFFEEGTESSVLFDQQVAKQVTEATLYGSQEVNTWKDANGIYGNEQDLFVLMVLPLDNEFFDVTQRNYEALLRQYKAQLLKREAGDALKELDAELQKTREAPFGLTGMVFPPAP